MTFTLLGPVEISFDGRDCTPNAPKLLQLLAMLLAQPGMTVTSESLRRELWWDVRPASAQRTMQTYVYHLRKLAKDNGFTDDPKNFVRTRTGGYQLAIEPDQVDVFHFRRRYEQGRAAMAEQRYAEAAGILRSAMSLWSGPPLANVECGPRLTAYAAELQERRRNAHNLRIQAEIEAGMHRELLGELRALATENPLDEQVHAQLIQVLQRSGRRGEAVYTYHELRTTLVRELGLEPGRELQQLLLGLLSDDQPGR
ncbi:AfsR/SARP family transcriptional regulator [Kibdelosporangium persicum]|uniref:AfsR/SARP family transcriptional regulator n=1 Tax=Kibdelosporangium persicum TaxID=2698649 RepID=UPI0028B23531|nr:AfsR/SARP family transcriptional regulator [Kibdelosporangium persicum]